MLAALLVIVAVVAIVYLGGALYRLLDVLVQGVVGGVRLFWCLARWTVVTLWRGYRRTRNAMLETDTGLSQRTHAAWWVYSYRMKRAWIASQLRAWRKEKRG